MPTDFQHKPGILAAMPAESAACAVLGTRCEIAVSGVGAVAARAAALSLVRDREPSALVSWGTAGGLDPALKPGTLVVYTKVVDAARGLIIEASPAFLHGLLQLLRPLRAVAGAGLAVDQPVVSRTEKSSLHLKYACSTVDMESWSIASVATEAGIPFIGLRAIVDPAHACLPTTALAGMATPDHALVNTLRALLRKPGDLPALCRLAVWYRRSLRTLSAAALMLHHAPRSPFSPESP